MRFAPLPLVAFLFLSSPAFAADPPTGAAILDRSVAKTGGAAAYARVKNMTLTGTVEMEGHNISGPISMYQEGDKSYSVIELPGIGRIEEGSDGDTVWEVNSLQGARIKEGAERTAAIRAAKMTPLSSWREYYVSARTLGSENVAGKPAWKVQMTPKDGAPEIFYFDRASELLVRTTQTLPTALGDIPVDVVFSDYRAVDGVRMPFRMTQQAMSQTLNMRFDQIACNVAMEPGRFGLPAAVQALLAKRK